jgi:hypothetical protein
MILAVLSGSQGQPGNPRPEALPPIAPIQRQSLLGFASRETRIADLESQRQQLHQSDLAPATAWLEKAKCHNRECYQWYWRSDKPIFNGKKRCYVGMDGSAAVAAAQQAIGRRKELERVDRQLKKLKGLQNSEKIVR